MTPNYLEYDKAVYFPKPLGLLLQDPIYGPGYTLRADCVILRAGTEAPDYRRPSHLPVLAHRALYHALASGRLVHIRRGKVDRMLREWMRVYRVGFAHRWLVWASVRVLGGRSLHRSREAMLACGAVLRPR